MVGKEGGKPVLGGRNGHLHQKAGIKRQPRDVKRLEVEREANKATLEGVLGIGTTGHEAN